ncbi:hypothetical protein KR009_005014 [Drosophila setifemur]|nr:hypothetical protein KR009_005014 [Drosophila setifemur]
MTNSLIVLTCLWLCFAGQLQAASIVCGAESKAVEDLDADTTTPSPSEVNKFVHSLQCTLEKAKPWIANIEKEAKILEEKARDVTRSLFQRFNLLVSVLTLPPNTEKDKNQEKDKDQNQDKDQEQNQNPDKDQNQEKDQEEATTTSSSQTEASSTLDTSSSSSKNDPKDELTTSSPPIHMDWLEDDANEVDYNPERRE